MAGFLGDILQGAAQAVPDTVQRANEFEQRAQQIQLNRERVVNQAANTKELAKTRTQQRNLSNLKFMTNVFKLPPKQRTAALKGAKELGMISEDFFNMGKTMTDEQLDVLQKMSIDDPAGLTKQMNIAIKEGSFDLLNRLAGIQSLASDAELKKEQIRKEGAQADVLSTGVSQEAKTKDILQGGSAVPQGQPQIQGQPPVQSQQPQVAGGAPQGQAQPIPAQAQQPTVGGGDLLGKIANLRNMESQLIQQGTKGSRAALVGVQKSIASLENNIQIKTDELGNLVRINTITGKKLPLSVNDGQKVSGKQLLAEIPRDKENLIITPGQVLAGSGLGSNLRAATNALIGTLGIPGEVFPATTEARNTIKSFNQSIITSIGANLRFPVAEQKTIKGFLIDEKAKLIDPDENITKMIGLVKRFEGDVIKFQTMLNRGNIPKEQRIALATKVNNRLGILSQMSTTGAFKLRAGRIRQMTAQEIDSLPAEGLTEGQIGALIRRREKLIGK